MKVYEVECRAVITLAAQDMQKAALLGAAVIKDNPRLINSKPDETVVFAWIVFESRAHRDEVNAKVMNDPRLAKMGAEAMPFDCKRMAYGGFEVLVDACAAVPDRV